MAVESKGFSIREYALEMRNVDVVKCWPFNDLSDQISKELVHSLLAPMTVKRFKWWSDELELVKSISSRGESSKPSLDESTLESGNVNKDKKEKEKEKEKIELVLDPDAVTLDFVCPICRNFTAPTALAAVSHVDWCLARGLRGEQRMKEMKAKMKAKMPKKRSIVEIFAVAPQVERVDSDDDDDDDEGSVEENETDDSKEPTSSSGGGGLNMKYQKGKKPKLKHESTSKMKKQATTTKVKKKVVESGRYRVDRFLQSIAKEKPRKLKLQSSVKFTAKPKSSHHGKSVLKDIRDAACIHRKKPSLKCLVKMKNKSVGTSKLMKRQKSGTPVCEHHKSETSGKNSSVFTLQHDNKQVNQRGNLQGDKHLGFSERCTSSKPKRNHFPGQELPKFFRGCGSNSTSFVKGDDITETDKHWDNEEVNGSEEIISISTGSEKETPQTRETQSSEIQQSHIPIRRSNIPSFKRPDMSFREYLTDSSVTSSQSTLQNRSSYTFGQAAAVDPFVGTRPTYLSLLKERSNANAKPAVESDILGTSSRIHRGADYQSGYPSSAVPLEHAESFQQISSPGFVVSGNANHPNHPILQSNLANHPSQYLPHQPSDHLSPKDLIRSLCSFPNWQQRELMNGNFVHEDFYSLPLNSQGELIHFNSNGKGMMFNSLMRPTISETDFSRSFPVTPMRRDYNLGGRSGTAMNHQLPVLPVQNPGMDGPRLSLSSSSYLGGSQGIARRDFQFEERNSSICNPNLELMNEKMKYKQVNVVQPTMRLMGKEFTVGRGSNDLQGFEDGRVWTDKQIIAEHQPAATPIHTSSSSLERVQRPVSELRGNLACSSGTQVKPPPPPRRKQTKPPVWVSRQNVNCSTGSGYPNDHFPTVKGNRSSAQSRAFPRAPAFMEPIEQVGYGCPKPASRRPKFPPRHENARSIPAIPANSSFQFPFLPPDSGRHVHVSQFQNMPPWLLSATHPHQKTQSGSHLPNADGGKHHHCAMSEEHAPKRNEPSEGCNSTSSLNAEPSCDSTHIASLNTIQGDQASHKERMSPRIGVEELDQGTKPRKRPALVSDDSANPAKVANLAVTEKPGAETALSSSMAALGLDSASTVKCGQIETPMNETRSSPATDTLKTDGVGIAKLSAGAKHIIKPRPKLNHEDSRPTHSTIPFAASVGSAKILLSEKSSQIYKF